MKKKIILKLNFMENLKDSFELERNNFKKEEEKAEIERNKPLIASKTGGRDEYEKYVTRPNEEFKKLIENHKIIHKLVSCN